MRIQHSGVTPVDLMHPPEYGLIPVQVGIGYNTGCHQVGMHAAWHFGRIGPRHSSGRVATDGTDGPAGAQIYAEHLRPESSSGQLARLL
jgi:hypothetical protein